MRRFQNILYVSGATLDESYALKQALSLARAQGTELHVLVLCPRLPPNLREYETGYEESLVDRLAASITGTEEALKMGPEEVRTRVEVGCGDTQAVNIVRRVIRDAYDLVIKQPEPSDSRRPGFRAMDMELLRLCPCPVWLCRPIQRPRTDIRVAVAIDPTGEEPSGQDLALQLLRLSRMLADTGNGELNVVSCWEYEFEDLLRHSPWIRKPEEAIVEEVGAAERNHRAALEALIRDSGVAGRIRINHVRGRPERAIPGFVHDMEIDILVMGTVARTGIPGFIIGNTAENIVGELRCSLVALKPNGFVSPVHAY